MFAERYVECNPGRVSDNPDTILLLAFALAMLNTDLHNQNVKRRMSPEDFMKNLRGTDDGNDLDATMLKNMYTRIQKVRRESREPLNWLDRGVGKHMCRRAKTYFYVKKHCQYKCFTLSFVEVASDYVLFYKWNLKNIHNSSFGPFGNVSSLIIFHNSNEYFGPTGILNIETLLYCKKNSRLVFCS